MKRQYDDFKEEIDDCLPGRCTLMHCTVGPLAKGDSVIFKIRSRLMTETQIKVNFLLNLSQKSKFYFDNFTELCRQGSDFIQAGYPHHQTALPGRYP